MSGPIFRFAAGLQHHLPREFVHVLMAARRRRAWREAGVIFIHVPKAAGTSIARAIYGRPLGHMKASTVALVCPTLFRELPTFAVVRNPWDRLVSAYHFAAQGGTGDAGMHRKSRYRGAEFRSFAVFLDEWFRRQRLAACDFVFQPQSLYVCRPSSGSAEIMVDFVGRVERMDEVSAFLAERLGARFAFSRSNASERQRDYRTFYPEKWMQRLVAEKYPEDVALFGYDF